MLGWSVCVVVVGIIRSKRDKHFDSYCIEFSIESSGHLSNCCLFAKTFKALKERTLLSEVKSLLLKNWRIFITEMMSYGNGTNGTLSTRAQSRGICQILFKGREMFADK